MAITFVGSGENSSSNGAAITITLPSMVQGDVVYVGLGTGGGTTALDVTTSGYTELPGSPISTPVPEPFGGMWRKVQGASPDSTVASGSGTADKAQAGIAYVLRGVDTTTPEDATPTTIGFFSSVPDSPSITTITANAWNISFGVNSANDAAVTAPSGYSNQVDIAQGAEDDITVGMASAEIASPGATNPAAWTNWASETGVAASIAVRPAAAAPAGRIFKLAGYGGGLAGTATGLAA